MLFKQDMRRFTDGVQTGLEAFGTLKTLYHCGQAAFSLGTRIAPFLL